MAESDVPFNSLDSLGSGYGGIDAPDLNTKSLSAFEGDRLSMPSPDFPDHFTPMMPGANELTNQQHSIRNIVGNPATKPASPKRTNVDVFAAGLKQEILAHNQANQDKNEYARMYSYNAGPDGNAFYDRYKAYGQETFDKIGFHPYRDNEAIFNAGTSGWQDTKRMMTHSFWPLFTRGFVSGPKSLGKMLQGDFSADTEDAAFYSRAAAIGNSSKGGVGGFLNNTAMSFAYTAGIITEAVLEEAVAIGATALTGGGAAPALFATTANAGKNLLRGIKGLDAATDGMRAVNATVRGLDNVSSARKFWDLSKIEKGLNNSAVKFFNPLEHLSDAALKIAKNENNLTGLARLADAGRKTVGGFYGEIRGINMALSEARLEGGMKQNDVYNKLYNSYYNEHKEAPSDEMQQNMMNQAKQAGVTTLQWNTALIFMSNKIVLDNLVGVKGRGTNFLSAKTKDILDLKGGSIARTTTKQTLKSGKKVLTPELNWRKNNLSNTLKSFAKDPIRKSVAGGISYFKKNLTEALQENAQDVIASATESYYVDSFSNDKLATYDYAMGLTKSAVKNQFTGQGFETFASGFVMGMFAAPLNGVPHLLNIGYNKIKNPKEFGEYAAIRDTYGKNLVNELSNVDMADFWNANAIGLGMQAEAETVRLTGTEKESRDAADASFNKAIIRATENDVLHHYTETLESYKDLTPEEFEEAVPSVPPGEGAKYLEKLDAVISKIDRIEEKHNYYKKNFPNPINLEEATKNKNSPDYNDAVTTHHAWNVAIGNAVFLNESFDNTMERMSSIVQDVTSNGPLKKASFEDINVLFDNKRLANEVDMIKTELEGLNSLPKTSENTSKINFKTKKLEALKNYKEALESYTKFTRNKKQILDKLKEENPGISPEELDKEYDEVVAEQKDELEISYNAYLKVIAKESNQPLFNKATDEAFEKLIDFHTLQHESQVLVENINLLHNPKDFVEHVQKNKVWMKNIYDNRREYYEALKDQEFNKKEDNDLLNGLASRGLYISLDDFQMWQQFGITPEEIFNDVNKTVIKKSHPDYDEIIAPFVFIASIRNKKSSSEINSEAVQAELDELDKMQEARLNALDKFDTRNELSGFTNMTINELNQDLLTGEYADTIATVDEEIERLTFYKDGDVLKIDNIDGIEIDLQNFRALYGISTFASGVKYTITKEPNAEEVAAIKEEFTKAKQEVIDRSIEKGTQDIESFFEKPVTINNETDIDSMPPEVYNELVAAFEKYAADNSLNIAELDDYNIAFESFVRSNYIAASIIEEYNKNQQLETATKATDETYEIPKLLIGNELVSADQLSESVLRNYLKSHEIGLKELEAKEDKTSEDDLKISQYKLFIIRLNEYLDKLSQEDLSPEQKVTINAIQQIIKDNSRIKRSSKGYELDGVTMDRVTNVINQFKEEYKHVNADEITISFNSTIQKDGLTKDSIKAFVENLRVQKGLSGFSEFTYTEVEKELKEIYGALQDNIDVSVQERTIESLEQDLLTEQGEFGDKTRVEEIEKQISELKRTVQKKSSNQDLLNTVLNLVAEKTNEASRIAGNYLDNQIRLLFDNKPNVFNEDNISQEAFDNLFNTDPDNEGYLVSIKKVIDSKGLHIMSRGYGDNGIILYDKEAKVAGEVDLLAVDRSGKVYIIDVKTGKVSKWNNFNNENAKFPQKPGYVLQQLAYSNLLFNLTGLKANISILPVEIDYNKETGKVTSANKPKSKTLLEPGNYRIPLYPTPEQVAQIDSVIPKKGEVAPEEVERETSEEGESPAVTDQQQTNDEVTRGLDPSLVKFIREATSEQLNQFKQKFAILIAQNKIGLTDITLLQELVDTRELELAENAVVKLTENNLQIGDRLIAKEIIFTGKNNANEFASQGSEVTVVSVNNTTEKIVLKSIGAKVRQKTISFNELDKLFVLKENLMDNIETPTVKPTAQEKVLITESSDNVKDLLVNSQRKDELKTETKGKSTEDLDKDLFQDSTSDC